MLIPSIDIQGGRAVQLRQGRDLILDGGDPMTLLERFGRLGEVAVVDLDAAFGEGDNTELIERMVRRARCRVGGGIRDVATARRWLDAGAESIVIGTAAEPALLSALPRERVMVALDAWDDEVVVDGWRTRSGETVEARLERLRPLVGGFLATFVCREGTGTGLDLDRARKLREAVGRSRLVEAGGTATPSEVARLDDIGVDVQVGRALYDGTFDETDVLSATLRSDRRDGLWPTVVCDESGTALGLAWSSERSLRRAIETGRGFYESRRRGLWEKGATSGAGQELLGIAVDCDRDALRFTVRQSDPGFCHEERRACWEGGDDRVSPWSLERRIREAIESDDPGSYTRRLVEEPGLLAAKLVEEADELAAPDADTVHEAADLLYFLMVVLADRGVAVDDVFAELRRRDRRVTRRGGDRKPAIADRIGGAR